MDPHPAEQGPGGHDLFWVVKILSTTVGETAADFLNENVGLGLSATTALMALLLAGVLVASSRSGATSRRSTGSPSC